MHLQGILFDIDGTLVDSNDSHARCWIEAFAHYDQHFDYETIFHQLGKGGDLLVPDLLRAREMRRFGDELKKYRSKLYREKYMPHVEPFPRVKELLGELHERGIKLTLASSSDEEEVEYYTQLLGVGPLIEGSTSKKDAEHSKPNPEIFLAALERAGTDAERTITAGDTPYDILASHRIALPIAAVRSGGVEAALLAKAEWLFADVEELVRKIDSVDEYFEHD